MNVIKGEDEQVGLYLLLRITCQDQDQRNKYQTPANDKSFQCQHCSCVHIMPKHLLYNQ